MTERKITSRTGVGSAARALQIQPLLARNITVDEPTISTLIADVRMCRALTLLQVTDLSVTQIAFEVDYESPSKFSSRFRQRFGFAPGQVREGALAEFTARSGSSQLLLQR